MEGLMNILLAGGGVGQGLAEIAAIGVHTASIIFMHGLGDTSLGWKMQFDEFSPKTPYIHYVLPTAPVQPVTLNCGMPMTSWHDIKSLDAIDQDFNGIDVSVNMVRALIKKEEEKGIPSHRIMLGGFSQGACLALYTGLQYEKKLGGIISMSGYIPKDLSAKINPANSNTNIFMGRGDADPVVNPRFGEMSAKILMEHKIPLEHKVYPNMGHECCEKESKDVLAFIQKYLTPI